jgi:hypothetical protein
MRTMTVTKTKSKLSSAQIELTMELRWKASPGTNTKDFELQQAGYIVGESHKIKVWLAVPIKVVNDD